MNFYFLSWQKQQKDSDIPIWRTFGIAKGLAESQEQFPLLPTRLMEWAEPLEELENVLEC